MDYLLTINYGEIAWVKMTFWAVDETIAGAFGRYLFYNFRDNMRGNTVNAPGIGETIADEAEFNYAITTG